MSSVNILFHSFSEPRKVKEREELEFHVNHFDWFTNKTLSWKFREIAAQNGKTDIRI